MPVAATPVSTLTTEVTSTRWIQLVLGLVAMMSISSPQYVWTLFTKSFQDNLHTNLPAIQITFSIVIVLQTWLSPLQGYLVDKFGARLLIAIGCLLSGLGWVTSAYVTSLAGLYFTYGLFCGVGTGIVYIGIIGLMVRWFPDRRGFATGMVAGGYGFGPSPLHSPSIRCLRVKAISIRWWCSASFWALSVLLRLFSCVCPVRLIPFRQRRPWPVPWTLLRKRCCATRCSGCCS